MQAQKKWYTIRLHDGARHQFRGTEILHLRSPKAEIIISNLDCLGKTIFHNRLERLSCNGEDQIYELMHSEKEGYAYNELVVHLPLDIMVNPKKVMIMGGGTLYTALEVLKHPSVTSVDIVDYDPDITDFIIKNYDPSLIKVKKDRRVTIIHDDIRNYLSKLPDNLYDVVIDDLIDIIRIEDRWVLKLFPDIYRILKNEEGIFSTYLYPSWFHEKLNRNIVSTLMNAGFNKIMTTEENIFTYSWPEGYTAFLCAAKKWNKPMGLTNLLMKKNFLKRQIPTLQFHPELQPLHEWDEHPNAFI